LGSRKDSYVGAPSTHLNSRYGFVFDHCTFTNDNSSNAQQGAYRLARQWFHNQKCTPYGPLPLNDYSCQLGPIDAYTEPIGQISSSTLQNVGKMIVMNSFIGSHINQTHPWADWNTLGKISYRPAQFSKNDFLENLKEIGFTQLILEVTEMENDSPEIYLAEFNNTLNH
jgi:pectin methylesterase-like acyl-CoA thioesterase